MKLPVEFTSFVDELHDFDPKSTTFRYGEQHRPGKYELPGEYWVDFPRLKKRMEWAFDGLERIYRTIGSTR